MIDAAAAANPQDPLIHAVRTLVYDWSAAASGGVERDRLLKEAEQSAVRALQLDPGSPLALAYYAELLLDEGKFAQAFDLAEQAAAQTDPFDPLSMDVHRVFGTVLEGNGAYRQAIEEYQTAAEIAPNFTYLVPAHRDQLPNAGGQGAVRSRPPRPDEPGAGGLRSGGAYQRAA